MLIPTTGRAVYLARGATDLRKSIDALATLVQVTFRLDPCATALFVFCNRDRNKVKILEWDETGFWLHYKRWEQGRIPWPQAGHDPTQAITGRQLQWLLDGLALDQPQAHRPLRDRRVG